MAVHILVVDDDVKTAGMLRNQLAVHGHLISNLSRRSGIADAVTESQANLLVLGLDYLGDRALEVLQEVREQTLAPVIAIAGADSRFNSPDPLYAGADELVLKPLSPVLLIAKISVLLRRVGNAGLGTSDAVFVGCLRVDTYRREATKNGALLPLTRLEFDILHRLAKTPEGVVPFTELLLAGWGRGYNDIRLVHTHMCHLRRKLHHDGVSLPRIISVAGVGYRLSAE